MDDHLNIKLEKARKDKLRVEQQRKDFLAQKEQEAAEMREKIFEQKRQLEEEKRENEALLADNEQKLRVHEAEMARAEISDDIEENLVDQVRLTCYPACTHVCLNFSTTHHS